MRFLPRTSPLLIAIALIPISWLAACSQFNLTGTSTLPTLVSISVTPSSPSIAMGGTQQFTATGSFSDGSTKSLSTGITWSSSNAAVATIGSTGLATAAGVGSTTIQAASGAVIGSTSCTVSGPTLVSISVTPASDSIAAGTTQQFTATGTFSDGSTQDLTGSVTWSSSNTSVATVASTGLATAMSAGNTTIQATSGAVSGSTTLTVTGPTLVSISVTPTSDSLITGSTQQFTATGTFSNGSTQNLTGSVTWSSSNTSAATISSTGLATAKGPGTATIQAASGQTTGSTTLTVTNPTLVSISVTPSSVSIAVGATQQFTATGTYSNGSTQNLTESVTWSSSNTSVATIASTGLATAKSAGSTTIQAASGTVAGSTTLSVTGSTLTSISVTPSNASIAVGSTQQFMATGNYSDGSQQNLTGSVTWSSSSASVAMIASTGLATAKGGGSTTIQATSGTISGSTTLTVTTPTLVSIAVTPASVSTIVGGTQQFTATGSYSNGSTQNLTASVTWSSSSTSVATIASTGLATAKGAGSTTIQATSGAISGSTTLTVTNPTLVSIAVTPASDSITVSAIQQFTAMGTYNNGSTQNLTSSVTWSSSSTSVATISSTGLVTAVSAGGTTIQAVLGSVTGSTPLTVVAGTSGVGGCDGAGNCYIYASATGAGTGANWTDAYTGFGSGSGQVNPAAMTRGVTYWIANGTYGPPTFSSPVNGAEVITIMGASTTSHGPASGWNDSYAGQAVFGVGETNFATGYWKINGQARGSDWQSGYTIKFDLNGMDVQDGVINNLGSGGAASNLTFNYVEIRGSNMNYTYNSGNATNCIHYCDGGFQTSSPTNNLYVGYSWIHDVGGVQFQSNDNTYGNSNGSNWTVEYNYISRNRTGDQSAGNHSEAFSSTVQNMTVRYNYFQDIGSSGVITDASAGTPDVGPWYIYGNINFWTDNTGYPGIGDGFVAFFGETLHGTNYVVGNTIANINNANCSLPGTACNMNLVYTIGGDAGTPTIYVENNLLWNVFGGSCDIPASGWTFIADYNTVYASPGFNNCGSHAQTVSSGNPFVNWNGSGTIIVPYESLDFQIASDTSAGINSFSAIPAGCTAGINCANDSFNGMIYGADGVYDRGAMQIP